MDEPAKTARHLDVETLGPAAAALIEQVLHDRRPLAIHRGGEAVAEVRAVSTGIRTLADLWQHGRDLGITDEDAAAWQADTAAIRLDFGTASRSDQQGCI